MSMLDARKIAIGIAIHAGFLVGIITMGYLLYFRVPRLEPSFYRRSFLVFIPAALIITLALYCLKKRGRIRTIKKIGLSLLSPFALLLLAQYSLLGAILMAIGAVLNLIPIITNKGMMPTAGLKEKIEFKYHTLDSKARFRVLGDQEWLYGHSLGDIFIMVGVWYINFALIGRIISP